jgi:2-polyprenyl-3-methyl-5-hydroxy-6-metoxy-1,4-benzoquinol methylase
MSHRMFHCVVCQGRKFRPLFAHKGGYMSQCLECELVQLSPMPTASQIEKLYDEDMEHFTPYIEQIDVHREYFAQKIQQIGLKIKDIGFKIKDLGFKNKKKHSLSPKSYLLNLKLLDIGCAMGVLLEEAKKEGMKITGVDISKDAAIYCKRRGLPVYAGKIDVLGRMLPTSSFDIITAFQIIEHERNPLVFMRRVHKLLKDGGMVVLATPDYGGMWRRLMGKYWVGFTHPEHVVLLNFISMKILLTKAGFSQIEIRRDAPRPFPLSFALKRGADYFPFAGWLLRPLGNLLDRFSIKNPINPWDDMIVFARK